MTQQPINKDVTEVRGGDVERIEKAMQVIVDDPTIALSRQFYREWGALRVRIAKAAIAAMPNKHGEAVKELGHAIHYPDCWDTAAYPTLLDALKEIGCNPADCTKGGVNELKGAVEMLKEGLEKIATQDIRDDLNYYNARSYIERAREALSRADEIVRGK